MVYINFYSILEQYLFMHDLTEQFACMSNSWYSIFFSEQLFISSTFLSIWLYFSWVSSGVCHSVVQRRAQFRGCVCRLHASVSAAVFEELCVLVDSEVVRRVYLLSRIRLSFVPFLVPSYYGIGFYAGAE